MAKHENRDGYAERSTKIMIKKPITELSRLIGQKWFLPLEKLSEKSGVPLQIIKRAVGGDNIRIDNERKICKALEEL